MPALDVASLMTILIGKARIRMEAADIKNAAVRKLKGQILVALDTVSPDAIAKLQHRGGPVVSTWPAIGASVGLVGIGFMLDQVPEKIKGGSSQAIEHLCSSVNDLTCKVCKLRIAMRSRAQSNEDDVALISEQLDAIEDQCTSVALCFESLVKILVDSMSALLSFASEELKSLIVSVKGLMASLQSIDSAADKMVSLSMAVLPKLLAFAATKAIVTAPKDGPDLPPPILVAVQKLLGEFKLKGESQKLKCQLVASFASILSSWSSLEGSKSESKDQVLSLVKATCLSLMAFIPVLAGKKSDCTEALSPAQVSSLLGSLNAGLSSLAKILSTSPVPATSADGADIWAPCLAKLKEGMKSIHACCCLTLRRENDT